MRKLAVPAHACALAGALLLLCHTGLAYGADWPLMGDRHPPPSDSAPNRISLAAQISSWSLPEGAASRPIYTLPFHLSAFRPEISPTVVGGSELSRAVRWVSQAAARNGDRDFLVVDKIHGQIIQFADGRPIFVNPALTGASLADHLPPEALRKSFAEDYDVKYRITPAGRFTVSHGFNRAVGATLNINEIKGKDWSIAIHSTGSASRDARLRSPLEQDKHITEGCINVGADTMRRLAMLPAIHGRIALYILPIDERLIAQLF